MLKKVIIDIKGTQGADGDTNEINFVSEGVLSRTDGKYSISYNEGQMSENCNVKTKLIFDSPDSVTLKRQGDINSRMEIVKGKRNSCFYNAFGNDLCIGIYGETVDVQLDDSGGSVTLAYNVDSDLRLISRNTVKITVKEVKKCQ